MRHDDGKKLVEVLKNTTEKERATVARRLASIMKDVAFSAAHAKAEELVEKMFTLNVEAADSLTVNFNITLNGTVVHALLAGIRRKK
jgi:hypothetical protein